MLNKESTGLIVVDVQGKLARMVDDSPKLVSNCAKLIQGAQALDLPVVWLEQNPDKLGTTVGEISTLLSTQQPVTKFTFDACAEPSFLNAVKNHAKSSWLICGIEAHICVYQTAMSLAKLGLDVHLVGDCVSSRDVSNIQLAITKLSANSIEITGLEMCLYELVRDCRAPEFKTILNLIK